MEVGTGSPSSAGSGRGGGDREEAARGSGGAMRARVCARVRTPQGAGALLIIGGAIVGAAVVAWRRHAARKKAKDHHRGKQKEEEVLDDGVVENEQIQGKSDEDLSRENTEVEANGLEEEKTEEHHEIQANVDEIVADELDSEPADKFDPSSSRECTEIISATDRGDINDAGQDSTKGVVENEIIPNATEDVENSDESTLTISTQEVALEDHNGHDDVTDQQTTSTQITEITQMAAHQPQISDELKADKITETATLNNVSEHEEQKLLAQDPVAPVDSPASSSLPSLLKTAQKNRPVNSGQNETGMKLGQDCDNGELSKRGAAKGVAMVTMNRRAASMAILAIIFAMTIGVNVTMRLYATLRAT